MDKAIKKEIYRSFMFSKQNKNKQTQTNNTEFMISLVVILE